MDYLKIHVKIEDLSADCCTQDEDKPNKVRKVEDIQNRTYFNSVESGYKLSPNLQPCIRCNATFYDSNGLFRHNLTHLQVNLVKLPDKTLMESDQTNRNFIHSDLKSEILEKRWDSGIIKNEIDEICFVNVMDKFIDIDNSKEEPRCKIEEIDLKKSMSKSKGVENWRDTDYEIEEMNSFKIMDQLIDIGNLENSTKCELEVSSEDSMDRFIDIENLENGTTCEINNVKSENGKGKFVVVEHAKKGIKEDINNINIPKTKRLHQCNVCLKIFNYKRWHEHKDTHSQVKVECHICHKQFSSKRYMTRHFLYVHEGKPRPGGRKSDINRGEFKCDLCEKVYHHKMPLSSHIKNVHSNAVNCKICSSRLASEGYLANHMRRVHYDDGKVHSCNICRKGFKSPRYLRVHMKNSHYVSSKKQIKYDL